MEAEDRQDWNIFKQIFKDHWDGFKAKNPKYDVAYYNEIMEKMLNCGNPEKMGYIEYRCISCGQGKRLISISCKSTLCLRCGKVYVDDWVNQVSKMLYEGVIYQPIVLTEDPMIFPQCGKEMEIWKIWHPKYGVIYDELEQKKKGTYEQQEETRIQGGNRRSIRSPSRGIQIPLFGVRNRTYG